MPLHDFLGALHCMCPQLSSAFYFLGPLHGFLESVYSVTKGQRLTLRRHQHLVIDVIRIIRLTAVTRPIYFLR